jgi:hypothetical protein
MRVTNRYERVHRPTGFAIKRATEDVPNDGRFHLVRNGQIVASFRTERDALLPYREAIQQSGWVPAEKVQGRVDISAVVADQAAAAAEDFWHESSKHRRRGGKGRW